MMNANLVAAMPHPHVLELCRIQGPLQWDILADPPNISGGHLQFGDGFGFGVSVAEGLETRYPYVEGDWRITIDREDVAPHGAR